MENLWNIPESITETPLSVLKEQAASLGRLTKGRLCADINKSKFDRYLKLSFYIVAPYLDNYRYELLHYVQPVTIFPGELHAEVFDGPGYIMVADIENFNKALKDVVRSERTQNILSALLAQSSAA